MKKATGVLKQYETVINKLAASDNKLRFGRGTVSISDIAQQYYCEKALHLNYEHPSEPTKGMIDGVDGHENITTQDWPCRQISFPLYHSGRWICHTLDNFALHYECEVGCQ